MRALWLLISRLVQLWHTRQVKVVGGLRMSDETTSTEVYHGAWRPALGWLCVIGMGWQLFIAPLLTWISPLIRIPPPPTTDLEILAVLVSTTLGIAGYRTVEKVKGVTK